MTDQERQLLEELAGRVQKAPVAKVDREADELIRKTIGARPDALYILTQTVLIQEMALNQARQQMEDLKRQQPPVSFLGSTPSQGETGWGRSTGSESREQPPSGYRASSYQTGSAPPPPPAPAPPPLPEYAAPQRSGFSGFLQNAAQTAAGVMAGEVAFSALSSLFGHHGSSFGNQFTGSGFLGGGGGGAISPGSETIINNYYEEDRGGQHGHRENVADGGAGGDSTSNDVDDVTDDLDDSSSDDSSSDDSSSDDTLSDDILVDDGSSYDSGSDSDDV